MAIYKQAKVHCVSLLDYKFMLPKYDFNSTTINMKIGLMSCVWNSLFILVIKELVMSIITTAFSYLK